METKKVSNNMLERMPIYLNYIKALPESTKNISATKIASALGLGEVSVRKDLAKVSGGGRCKLGYACEDLINDIESFLGVKTTIDAVVVGKGDMLQVLLNYEGFEASGLRIVAGFDTDCFRECNIEETLIYPISELQSFCQDKEIKIGIIMVATEDAQNVCNQLVAIGVEGIWNFTPVHLEVPEHIVLQNESFIASITKLRMLIKERNEAL